MRNKQTLRERAETHAAGQNYPNERFRSLVEEAWLAGYRAARRDLRIHTYKPSTPKCLGGGRELSSQESSIKSRLKRALPPERAKKAIALVEAFIDVSDAPMGGLGRSK